MAKKQRTENEQNRLSWRYFCVVCLKSTYETGAGESEYRMCKHCFENTDWQKYVAEGGDPRNVPYTGQRRHT